MQSIQSYRDRFRTTEDPVVGGHTVAAKLGTHCCKPQSQCLRNLTLLRPLSSGDVRLLRKAGHA